MAIPGIIVYGTSSPLPADLAASNTFTGTYTGGARIINGMVAPPKREGEISLPPLALKPNTNYVLKVITPTSTDFSLSIVVTE